MVQDSNVRGASEVEKNWGVRTNSNASCNPDIWSANLFVQAALEQV